MPGDTPRRTQTKRRDLSESARSNSVALRSGSTVESFSTTSSAIQDDTRIGKDRGRFEVRREQPTIAIDDIGTAEARRRYRFGNRERDIRMPPDRQNEKLPNDDHEGRKQNSIDGRLRATARSARRGFTVTERRARRATALLTMCAAAPLIRTSSRSTAIGAAPALVKFPLVKFRYFTSVCELLGLRRSKTKPARQIIDPVGARECAAFGLKHGDVAACTIGQALFRLQLGFEAARIVIQCVKKQRACDCKKEGGNIQETHFDTIPVQLVSKLSISGVEGPPLRLNPTAKLQRPCGLPPANVLTANEGSLPIHL